MDTQVVQYENVKKEIFAEIAEIVEIGIYEKLDCRTDWSNNEKNEKRQELLQLFYKEFIIVI